MMDNWGRKERGFGNYSSRGVWRQRSSVNRPPPHDGYKPVPSWERKFCESVGLIPWRKLLDAKRFMHLYKDVVNWNDAAGEEAFKNAKSRYWAEINGLPCNATLPDPDLYIDKVDWDAKIDPELILDLERSPEIHSQEEHDPVILGKPSLLEREPFACGIGWDNIVFEPDGSKGWNDWDDGNKGWNDWDDGNKGWDNWDDSNNVAGGLSEPWQSNGYNEQKRENRWERERSTGQGWGHRSFGKRVGGGGNGNSSGVNRGGFGWKGGCKGGGRGRRVEAGGCEQPRWAEKRAYCGRW